MISKAYYLWVPVALAVVSCKKNEELPPPEASPLATPGPEAGPDHGRALEATPETRSEPIAEPLAKPEPFAEAVVEQATEVRGEVLRLEVAEPGKEATPPEIRVEAAEHSEPGGDYKEGTAAEATAEVGPTAAPDTTTDGAAASNGPAHRFCEAMTKACSESMEGCLADVAKKAMEVSAKALDCAEAYARDPKCPADRARCCSCWVHFSAPGN